MDERISLLISWQSVRLPEREVVEELWILPAKKKVFLKGVMSGQFDFVRGIPG
jgi:hypothetical protein